MPLCSEETKHCKVQLSRHLPQWYNLLVKVISHGWKVVIYAQQRKVVTHTR